MERERAAAEPPKTKRIAEPGPDLEAMRGPEAALGDGVCCDAAGLVAWLAERERPACAR